jgi:hypothetical protein
LGAQPSAGARADRQAVDEALNGGAGDEGQTVAKALNLIADNQLRLDAP